MSGIKGRSGKLTTAAQKSSASERGKTGMAKRWGAADIPPIPVGLDPASDDPVARLGKPVTWGDELKRQQVEGERIQNRRREVEVQRSEVELAKAKDERDLARGALKTRDEFRASITAIVEEIVSRLSILVDAAVETHQPEQQPRVRHLMEAAVYKLRDDVRAKLKEQTT